MGGEIASFRLCSGQAASLSMTSSLTWTGPEDGGGADLDQVLIDLLKRVDEDSQNTITVLSGLDNHVQLTECGHTRPPISIDSQQES